MNKKEIKEGDKYGHWIVVCEVEPIVQTGNSYRQFKLMCVCGTVSIKKRVSMKFYNQDSSCGCNKNSKTVRDITKEKFTYLQPITQTNKRIGGSVIWECLCDCGNVVERSSRTLTSGKTTHCGCIPIGKHHMTGTPTYVSWGKMLSRIRSQAEEYVEWYHDVTVCDRWDTRKGGSFENFLEDMGERPEGKTLNRVQGAKVYSKETCEWSDLSVQSYDQKRKKHNLSGRTGVAWRKERKVWVANISKDREVINLYYGPSYEEACKARQEAELKYYGFIKE